MPYPKNKYRKGYSIFGWSALMYENLDKGRWVYLREKVVHPSVIMNMTLNTVKGFLERRLFSEAINQQREYYSREYQRPYPEGVVEPGRRE